MTGTFLLSSWTAPREFFTFTKVSTSTGCGASIFLKKALTKSLWQLFLLDPWPPSLCRVRRSSPVAPDFTDVSANCWTSEAASLPQANLCKSKIARGDWSCISPSGSTTCFLFIPTKSWTSNGYFCKEWPPAQVIGCIVSTQWSLSSHQFGEKRQKHYGCAPTACNHLMAFQPPLWKGTWMKHCSWLLSHHFGKTMLMAAFFPHGFPATTERPNHHMNQYGLISSHQKQKESCSNVFTFFQIVSNSGDCLLRGLWL